MVVFDSKLLEYQGVPAPNMVPAFPEPPTTQSGRILWSFSHPAGRRLVDLWLSLAQSGFVSGPSWTFPDMPRMDCYALLIFHKYEDVK